MGNLLNETKEVLERHGKTLKDIVWIGGMDFYTKSNFKEILSIDYDNGFGAQEIAYDLLVVGNDFWLEREEYDGQEGWVHKSFPVIQGGLREYFKVKDWIGWKSLKTINDEEE